VHRAVIKETGEQICLKIQYPGVAAAVDSDLNAVRTLLKIAKIVPITEEFEQWFAEIREMMYREVDYIHEARKTQLFAERLKDDARFIVPKVYPQFSSPRVLATSFEPGVDIDSETTKNLPQARRNAICAAALDLCWKEVFLWGEMQTDPNFGNYFVRLGDGDSLPDKIVLLDFGAVREFSPETLLPGIKIIKGAFYQDEDLLFEGIDQLRFFRDPNTSLDAKRSLAKLCFTAIEPFVDIKKFPPPAFMLTERGEYRWGQSDLAGRLSLQAGLSAANRYFSIPPRELMFLARKIMGAYTFMTVLDAELFGYGILAPYIEGSAQL
jgi:predicted unusual protein kinase regulating ubiquinone biosynthesis (AarF/ABC1/UbiB family)